MIIPMKIITGVQTRRINTMDRRNNYGFLGFFLASPGKYLCDCPDQPYYGIDRKPHLIELHPLISKVMGISKETIQKRAEIIKNWLETVEEHGFIESFYLAQSIQDRFRMIGEEYCIIMCEIWLPGLVHPSSKKILSFQDLPRDFFSYGFDVCGSVANYNSAIYQPGLLKIEPYWINRLNKWGLFPKCDDAEEFRNDFTRWKRDGQNYEIIHVMGNESSSRISRVGA